jgi:hypothetical protein
MLRAYDKLPVKLWVWLGFQRQRTNEEPFKRRVLRVSVEMQLVPFYFQEEGVDNARLWTSADLNSQEVFKNYNRAASFNYVAR